jgi:hypothetical protein
LLLSNEDREALESGRIAASLEGSEGWPWFVREAQKKREQLVADITTDGAVVDYAAYKELRARILMIDELIDIPVRAVEDANDVKAGMNLG